jgi:ribonuclease E
LPLARAEQIGSERIDTNDDIASVPEQVVLGGEQPKRNNARRGPNRRRPRNPNYKRPETDGDLNTGNDTFSESNNDMSLSDQLRPVENDFVERAEPSEPQSSYPSQVTKSDQNVEKTVTFVEQASKPVEAVRQETE